jgi:hypothetical protein
LAGVDGAEGALRGRPGQLVPVQGSGRVLPVLPAAQPSLEARGADPRSAATASRAGAAEMHRPSVHPDRVRPPLGAPPPFPPPAPPPPPPRAPAHLALSSRPIELFWEVEAVHISRCGLHDDGGRLGLSGALANSNAAKKQAAAHAGEPPMDAEGVGGRLRKGLRCASTPAMRVPPALALLWHCYPHTVWGKRFLGLGFLPRPPGSLTWACWFTAAATRPREAGRWRGGYPDSARVP